MNSFASQPDIKEPVLAESWTCPITGMRVPLDPTKNLLWRADLLEMAETDPLLQTDLYTACSQSAEFFVLAFCFTLRVFNVGVNGILQQAEEKHVPFCLWPEQAKLFERLVQCIEDGEENLTDKSRDMGATWLHIAAATWAFLFKPHTSGLFISRKEDVIDQLDGMVNNYPNGRLADPGTLFGKIDYILNRLPAWFLPLMGRKKLHLVNHSNGSRIDGESSNAAAGSSDRRDYIFLDEVAKIPEAESIIQSTKAVTACRLFCSTPLGSGTAFSKLRLSGMVPVSELMWWASPEKAKGLYAAQDALGRWKMRSPWYDAQCRASSPKEVATEIDADHLGSGERFFEDAIILEHQKLLARPPRVRKTIAFKKTLTDELVVRALRSSDSTTLSYTSTDGPWKIWCPLVSGRPEQSKTYTVAADISKGQGASNSVCVIGCNETHEKVAEYADANTPPYEFAKIVAAAALWAGGRDKRPMVIWENNGDPGIDFQRVLVHTLRYPNLYFDRQPGTLRQRIGKRYGWRSNTDKKAEALGVLRRAYATGKIIDRSSQSLTECLSYIHYDGGGIGPAALVSEPDAARKAHGDRVIATMLLTWVWGNSGGTVRPEKSTTPERCFGHRLEQWRKTRKENKDGLPRIGQVLHMDGSYV
jgi:hypothetical protein